MSMVNIDEILVKQYNATKTFIYGLTQNECKYLVDKFAFQPEGYRYTPAYKSGKWSGWIKPLSMTYDYNGNSKPEPVLTIPSGLTNSVCNEINIFSEKEPKLLDSIQPISITDAVDYLPMTPYQYQLDAVEYFLEHQRSVIISPTGSGKSLIIYLILMSILEDNPNHKALILVPTIGLVSQMYNDIKEYCSKYKPEFINNIHQITAGKDKDNHNCNVYISTWQSIHRLGSEYFEQFTTLLVDEVHKVETKGDEGKCISNICNQCTNAYIRCGLTGTLSNYNPNSTRIVLEGIFGDIYSSVDTKQLMDMGILTNLVNVEVNLNYSPTIPKMSYADEISYTTSHPKRNLFLSKFTQRVCSKNGNTLLLINYVEKQGKVIMDHIMNDGFTNVYFVSGSMKVEERERIRQLMEHENNCIIVATYQVFQEGINIKNIRNIILGSPTKSIIRTLQSIGRGLRLHKDKEYCYLYDIVDRLTDGDQHQNDGETSYSVRHYETRKQYYKEIAQELQPINISISN